MRQPSPWFWDQKQVWAFTLGRKRRRLGPNPEGAPKPRKNKAGQWVVPQPIMEAFHRLMGAPESARATPSAPVGSGTTWAIFEAYLEWVEANRPASYKWYKRNIKRFTDAVPNMPVERMKPFVVQQWLDKQTTWSDNYKRGFVTAIKRAFSWAVKAGHIPMNPVQGLEKPTATSRDQLITQAQFKSILKLAKDDHFRDLLNFVWYTGCRPQEAFAIEARHVGDGVIEFPKDESKGKKLERQIFLNDQALKIVKKWAKKNPEGAIFRNTRGKAWTAFSCNCRFFKMKEALGFKPCMYALRHSYAHHAITSGGLSLEETAALLGHTSTTMVYKVYGKLKKNKGFMREAAKRATGGA